MLKKLFAYRPVWVGAILLLCVAWAGFRPMLDSDRWPEPDATINPDFRKHPPIAQEITMELLDQPEASGANVILSAHFDERTIQRINGKYLAMRLSSRPVKGSGTPPLDFLRDDGYDGDAKPGDGWYSKSFTVPAGGQGQITALLEAAAATARMPHNAMVFKGRQMVPNTNVEGLVKSVKSNRGTLYTINPALARGGGAPNPLFVDHSLMITDLSVVEDPDRTYNPCTNTGKANGVWTFGELMRQLASPNPGAIATDAQTITFIEKWLNTWNNNQLINGENVTARPTTSIMNTWQNLSIANGAAPGNLLLENVPFRLMAIVNRIDLRGSSGYGFSDAGEGRFVFCLLDDACNARRMTVIFEYGINKSTCEDVHAYADQWVALAGIPFGDPSFNSQLEDITNQFTLCGTNPAKENESSLNQLRTDEVALGSPWELREFHLKGGLLNPATTHNEPALIYNAKVTNADVQRLADWVNANSTDILANTYTVPDNFLGFDFLGGQAHTESPPSGTPAPGSPPVPHHWDADPNAASPAFIVDKDVRHNFSLGTCSGCHGGDTQTDFTHIFPTGFGVVAPLSLFLTGDPLSPPSGPFMVPDAAGRPSYGSPDMRGFNDLWRRAQDLQDLIDTPCDPLFVAFVTLTAEPLIGPH